MKKMIVNHPENNIRFNRINSFVAAIALAVIALLPLNFIFGQTVVVNGNTKTITYITATGSPFTWTCTAGINSVTVQCWGAGGGGGSSAVTQYATGGGGGGGAYATSTFSVTPTNSYSVVIGAGGAAGTVTGAGTGTGRGTSATAGSSGGNTMFSYNSTNYVIAVGGGGGGSTTTTASGAAGVAGAAGSCTPITGAYSGGAGGGSGTGSSSKYGNSGGSSAGTSANGVAGLGISSSAPTQTPPTGGFAGGLGKQFGSGTYGSNPGGTAAGGSGGEVSSNTPYVGGIGGDGKVVISYTLLTPPTLAVGSANVDNSFTITFTDDATWRSNITAVKFGANTLTLNTDYTLASGVLTLIPGGSASSGLRAAGTQTVTIVSTDYTDATVSQTIGAGAINKLQVLMPNETAVPGTSTGKTGTPTTQTAGNAVSVTVKSVDQYWNVVSSTQTIAITSSDANATLPANAALVAGSQTFSLTFKTAGSYTATATDQASALTANTGSSTTVSAGTVNKLQLLMPGESPAPGTSSGKTGTPTDQTAGTSFTITVNAVDANWNVVSNTNTIAITSTDANSTMPGNLALVAGTKPFSVTIKTASNFTLTATNSTNGSITANTSPSTTFNVGVVNKLLVLMPGESPAPGTSSGKTGTPSAQTAGTAFNVTVNAVDANWNFVSSNTCTVAISSSDGYALLPSNAALASGTGTFSVTCLTSGSKTITATDQASALAANTGTATTINAGALAKLQLLLPGETPVAGSLTGKTGTPTSQISGIAFTITVNGVDASWNLITGATDNIQISSSDVSATLPGNNTLASGTRTFSVTASTVGSSTVTASNLTNGSITASQSASITVNPTPIITATPSGLAAFTTNYGTASTAQAFTVSGSNLIANITVTAPTGYEVSKTVGGASGYAATQTLTQTSGSVSNVIVYVRLTSAAVIGSNSGNVAMSSTSATTINTAVSGSVNATLIAGWDFQTTTNGGTAVAAAPNCPTVLTANFGSGNLYLNGTNGSSSWIAATTGNELFGSTGSNLNTSGTSLSTTTTTPACLSPIGGTSLSANGKCMVYKFSMTNYKDLLVSYASIASGTGFTTQQWDISTDGLSWTTGQTITTPTGSFSVSSLTKITSLDGSTNAYLRVTLTGATGASGSCRFDNVQLNATPTSPIITTGGGPLTSLSTSHGTASSASSFTLAGAGLGTTISIDALSGYEFSTALGGTYTSTLSNISATGPTTIYVRLAASATVGSYNGNIHCSSGLTTLDIPMTTGTVTIGTPTLSISNTPVYNASSHSATVIASAAGTVSNVLYAGSATAPTNAGSYAITADFAATDNTNWTNLTGASAGTFVISKATPTLSISNSPQTYTGSAQAATVSASVEGTVTNVLYAGSGTAPTNANSYAVTANFAATDNTNYNNLTGASAGSFTISQLALTITSAAAISKTYDGNNTASITGTLNGIVNSDDVTLSGTGTFASVNVANDIVVTSTSTLAGTKAANYSLTQPTGLTANIYPVLSTFSKSGSSNWSTASEWTYAPLAATDLVISSGELIIDQTPISVHSITVNPGAKLTLNSAKTLNVGTFILQSDAGGTGTFVDNGGTLNASTTNVQQYLTTGRNWYISSPLSGASSAVFNAAAASNINKLYSYDETQGSSATLNWPQITDNSTSLAVGKGYVANVDASLLAATNGVTFSGGSLNTGDITTGVNSVPALSYTSDQAFAGYNLVGNPYCSYLNWNTVSKTNLASTMWYKTKVGGSYYFYTYHVVDGAAGIGISVPADVTNLIPPMQAFWVLASASGSSLTFHNSDRAHKDVTGNILRSRAQINSAVQLARLQVSNGVNTDETVLYTYPTASNQYDSYDSPKMSNGNAAIPEIYTLVSGEKLVINGMNSIPFDTEIPLGFTTGQAGSNFSIKASELNNFVAGTRVILKDYLDTNNPVIADLSDGSSYVFSSGVSTNNTSRFALIFKAPSITTGINPADSGSFWISTNANGQIILNGTPNAETSVAVYNAIGQRMAAQNLSSTIKVLDPRLVPGVYTSVLKSVGKTATTKVIIK